ncbi:hypothetical protein THTE_2247 [Thermogutta terrifontis]|uniref:Uncharacterized protein n=1 Tax=Thermogutta terrifontis TaxID=1331910 RepID=A0A286RFW1_9BACT|nr:hypothetical protein THTE_2247 [Thermogutta terrifontis]
MGLLSLDSFFFLLDGRYAGLLGAAGCFFSAYTLFFTLGLPRMRFFQLRDVGWRSSGGVRRPEAPEIKIYHNDEHGHGQKSEVPCPHPILTLIEHIASSSKHSSYVQPPKLTTGTGDPSYAANQRSLPGLLPI